MIRLLLLVFAVFWAWEALRYALQTYLPSIFQATRFLHPLVVLAFPLWRLWPDYVAAAAVAGVVAIFHVLMERLGQESGGGAPIQFQRSRSRSGLPDLP